MTKKEKPLIFNEPMVQALLNGSKKQTRRVCKPQPIKDAKFLGGHYLPGSKRTDCADIAINAPYVSRACPHGKPGSRIYVKETFYAFGRWETRFSAAKGRDKWHFVDMTLECSKAYLYAADSPRPQPLAGKRDSGVAPKWWKRPAIFMPRVASRIDLEITAARVEHLQIISEADAAAEGLKPKFEPGCSGSLMEAIGGFSFRPIASAYADLWEQLNGFGSWDANPFVWVIQFRRLPC